MSRPFNFFRFPSNLLLLACMALTLAGCGGHKSTTASTIVITASSTTIAAGQTIQLHATEHDSANNTTDVTAKATWTSNNTGVATVTPQGVVKGIAAGSTSIQASVGTLVGALPLTIGSASVAKLAVTPASPQVFTGASQQFTATATYSDGSTKDLSSTVIWSANPAAVATINTAGLLKAVAAGTFTVTATTGTLVATSNGLIIDPTLNSIAITPAPVTLASRGTQQFTAIGTYIDQSKKDLTSSVTWTSSNTSALTITAAGLATAGNVTAATAVTVTAQFGSVTAAAAVNVTPQAAVTGLIVKPTSGSIAQGSAQQNTATALYSDGTQEDVTKQVTWSVSASPLNRIHRNAATAGPRETSTGEVSVDQNGVAFANLVGAANVQASLGSVVAQGVLLVRNTTVESIAINTPDAQVPVGATQQLSLSGVFNDGSSQDLSLTANWQSSNTSIATIDSKGLMTAVSAGNVRFTASFGGIATSTGDVDVLSVDLVSLTVKVPNPVNNVGGVQQLTVLGLYSDGRSQDLTRLASWRSSNSSALQVSSTGFAQCLGADKVQVTSTVAGFSTVTSVDCIATKIVSFDVLPHTASFALGTNLQFTALGHAEGGGFFDGTKLVTWTSSDPTVLTINQNGLAKSGKVGSTTVTAVEEGVSAVSGVITVTNATITNMTMTPVSARIAVGTHAQFNVLGWFSDGSVQDISDAVLWTVSDTTIGSADLDGTVFGIAPGAVTVTANAGTVSVSAPLTVTNATLLSTIITPGNIEMPQGVERQLSLVGNFSDGTTQDLSADAIWLSPTPTIAFSTQTGGAVGFNLGIGTIGAQLGNFTSSTQVNVTNASLTAIALTPASTVIREQGSQQMTAIGTFSDGYQQNLYLNAVFTIADPTLVYIRAQGLAIGTGIGTTQITASFRGLQASTTSFRVESGTLVSIALTPANPAVTAGGRAQLTATGTYADGTTSDLSRQATWTSSNPAVLSVDSNGLATGHATSTPVTVTVTAQFGTATQSFTVTVSPAASNGAITGITVSPSDAVIGSGSTRQFSATATYSSGNTGDVSGTTAWTSSNPSVATVNSSGLASAVGPGSTIITATSNAVSANATLTVEGQSAPIATLTSIAITPASATINAGSTQLFTATGTWSDGTIEDVSSRVSWQSSSTTVATINSGGVATGVSAGATAITAQLSGTTGAASLTVNPGTPPGATVTAITISPVTATIAAHATQQFAATATYSNNTTQNVTTSVTWSSSSPSVATINQAGLATGVANGSTAIAAALSGRSGTASLVVGTPGPGNPALTAITVAPASTSIVVGATQQYTATGTYSDGSTQNITGTVTWTSSSAATATVTSAGLATGVAAGSTTITAQSGSLSGTSALTVTASTATLTSLVVTPTSSQIITGLSQQFACIGAYSDGTTRNVASSASWSSSNQAVALVNTTGQVTGLTAGIATITCTSGSMQSAATVITNTATLQSVAISPSGASFAAGATQQLKLTGSYSDGSEVDLTSAATWASPSPSVATVSTTGLVTGVTSGTARITAAFQTQTGATTVQITSATLTSVAISPSSLVFAKGTTQQFTVTGTYSDGTTHDVTGQATYLSSNASVITVSSAGLAFGASAGTAHITVSVAGVAATTQTLAVTSATLVSIAITPANPTFAKGTTQKFTAIGTFSDGSTQDLSNEAVWSSSNPQTATIDVTGIASSGTPGSTVISATFQGVTASTGTVQVSSAVLNGIAVSPSTSQIAKGTSQQFTATGAYSDGTMQNLTSNVNWSSSSPTVASISATGLATGDTVGSDQITAAFQGYTASTSSFQVTPATLVSIAFSPSNPSVAAGTSAQVTVTGTFSDGTTQNLTNTAMFSSSNPAAVTVNSSGVITGVSAGTSTVTVSVNGVTNSFTATDAPVTLTSIAITPTNPPSFAKGTSEQFTATGTFSDGSTQDLSSTVTWTSSDATVYTVDAHGLATGTGVGSATLTAAYQGHNATTPPVQVTPAVVASIAVTPAGASVVMGSTQQYTATATYTDATTQNVTSSATWSSSNATVATISSTTGLAAAVTSGSTTITALFNSIPGSTSLTVTPIVAPTLVAISVAPFTSTVARGNTQQFTATGDYSDGSTAPLTSQATWQSSAPTIATVNNQGLATSIAGGTTQISATVGSTTGIATLTVSTATLVSLSVTPATATVADGTTQQYTATGTLSDGSTQNLTNSVTWTSSNTGVATINSSGLAATSSAGSTTITATAGTVTGTAALTVTAATVVTLQAIPPAVTLPAGGTQQLMMTAVFSDGSSQNVTNSVTYASANTGVAVVNATGNLTATGAGTSSITATLGTATATVQVVVTSATLTSLAVTPASFSLGVGLSQQLTATGTFSDGSTQNQTSSVVWVSSAPTVATVSTSGKVQASQTGTATITATTGTVSGTSSMTATTAAVTAIAISPATVTMAVGQTQQFTATATLSDGTQQNVTTSATWSTSDITKGTVSNVAGFNGVLTTLSAGNLTVTVTLNAVSGSTPVTVTNAVLTSTTVTPSPATLPAGTSQQLTVTGNYSDGSTANVTNTATWTSSSAAIASVDTSGVLHGVAPGTTTVTATVGLTTKQDSVVVTNAVLSSISITPTNTSIPVGVQSQLTATGNYSDGSTANLTSQVQWSSFTPTVATVSGTGLVSALSAGSTQITASLGSISKQIPLTVSAAVLSSIAVQSSQSSFALGLSLPLTAIATYSDSSTQNVTTLVTWSSLMPSVGVVDSNGVATGVRTGSFPAKATLNGVSGTLSVTVTNAVLQSIVVTPANQVILNVLLGPPTQYTATGTFSDGTTQNITNTCHWAITSGLSVGSISQTGSFSTLGVGLGTLSATSGSIVGSTNFTVVSVL